MENKVLILSEREVKSIINADIVQAMEWVRQAVMIESKDILMPAKSSQILDDISKERVNCMPSTLLSHNVSGVKLISVFPKNKARGHKNVNGTLVLNETIAGLPIAFMGAAYLTLLRTAAIGVLASQYLAPSDVKTVGLIGAGEQARMHFYLLKYVHKSIKKCCVSSGSDATVEQFIHCFENEFPDVEFVACGQDYDSAVRDADIIVTATSSQRKLLRADTIKQGAFYIHVGGIEDEYDVVRKASKIVCDNWEEVKHREQTISVMYKENLLSDDDIYANLSEIVLNRKNGRENEEEFIYFNSVGLSYIDVYLGYAIYKKALEEGIGLEYSLADTDE